MELFVYEVFIVFVFGTIIGSFLNVVIYRLHTGRSINGRSHCMSCGETLRWYELLPVVSYLTLRARCRNCSAYIPYRYLLVELLTGLVFLYLFSQFTYEYVKLVLHAILAALLIVVAVYDLRHTVIPNELTLGIGGVALFLVAYDAFLSGNVTGTLLDIGAGLGAGLFFFVLWHISHGKWLGLGDAKLAVPLGVIAGTGGALSMVVLSFWIGAVISLFLLLLTRLFERGKTVLHFWGRNLTMKSEVPFAPFLILGFLCVHYFHANIFAITALLFPFAL